MRLTKNSPKIMSVLKRPIVTEKSADMMEQEPPKYSFEVDLSATKDRIKSEVERVYEVEVEKVSTMIVRGKTRSRYTRRGVIKGKTPNYKKAVVTLKDNYEIDFYKHI